MNEKNYVTLREYMDSQIQWLDLLALIANIVLMVLVNIE